MKVACFLLAIAAASGFRVAVDKPSERLPEWLFALRKNTNSQEALALPGAQLPLALAVLGEQCRCKFLGMCTCSGAVEFVDCLADACSSGGCPCHVDVFEQNCNQMASVCPTVGLQCGPQTATCLQQPSLNNETLADILLDLKGMKGRKCKLEAAVHAGFVNADKRLRELEPPIQSRLDLLIDKGVKKDDMPWLGCGSEPTVKVTTLEAAENKEVVALAVETSETPGGLQFYLASKMEEPRRRFVMWMLGIVHVMLLLVFAVIYNGTRLTTNFEQAPPAGEVGKKHFRYGLCGCFQNMKISALALCCWPVRWADTVDKANKNGGMIKYWPAVLLMIGLTFVANAIHYVLLHPWTAYCVSLVMVGIAVVYRQKLRKQYGFEVGGTTCVEDFLTYMCCGCCAVVQEAREVEGTYVF